MFIRYLEKPQRFDHQDGWLRVIASLLEKGASVRAYDPLAMTNARKVMSTSITFCESAAQALENADCVLIVTEWDEFKKESLYNGKVVIDGRRVLDPRRAKDICDYHGICW